ncbi:MAG TPA: TIM barrel protein [Vicinamibacterales bacterium]
MSSRSFAIALSSGALTQLEWIDECSAQDGLDGVDFAVEHFPRRDVEYLAQIKKLCVDRCLTVAADHAATAFGAGEIDPQIDEMKAALDIADRIGAPLLRFSAGASIGSPGVAWRELVRGLKAVSERAKACNVTLAVQPREGSLVASAADVKRAFKECDSAWLRLAAPATVSWEADARDAVMMTAAPAGSDLGAMLRFRGFVSLEDEAGGLDATRLERWVATFYAAPDAV